MAGAGLFAEDDRVELIEGEVVEMAPIGSRHAACVNRLNEHFVERLRGQATVAPQNPVSLGELSEPQPDVAVLARRDDWYAGAHPGPADVLLLVEVADTTAAWDRQHKVPLYAAAGIPELWLVDLPAGVVEAYRAPEAGAYRDITRYGAGDELAPARFPDSGIPVAELFG